MNSIHRKYSKYTEECTVNRQDSRTVLCENSSASVRELLTVEVAIKDCPIDAL